MDELQWKAPELRYPMASNVKPAIFLISTTDTNLPLRLIEFCNKARVAQDSTILRLYDTDPDETITSLRQSLREARELIEALIDSPEFKNDALDYYVQYIGFGDYDAARKWLEEHGDAHP